MDELRTTGVSCPEEVTRRRRDRTGNGWGWRQVAHPPFQHQHLCPQTCVLSLELDELSGHFIHASV